MTGDDIVCADPDRRRLKTSDSEKTRVPLLKLCRKADTNIEMCCGLVSFYFRQKLRLMERAD